MHANKVYGAGTQVKLAAAELARRIQQGEVTHGMPVRKLARKEWRGLRTRRAVQAALAELASVSWVRVVGVQDAPGNVVSNIIHLHPLLRRRQ